MVDQTELVLLRRFSRTVRVATATALAEYELASARLASTGLRFQALAALSADGWRFPEAGLASADGLVSATVARDDDGKVHRLILQAQGAAGLQAYADRMVRLHLTGFGGSADLRFDRSGRAAVDLEGLIADEEDLATFTLEDVAL